MLFIGGFSISLAQDAQKVEVIERDADGKALRISVDSVELDLKELLNFLNRETNLTIIASEENIKDKKFSLTSLKDVTIEKMLEEMNSVLVQFGLATIRRNNTILITTMEKAVRMNVPVKPALTNVADYEKILQPSDEIVTQPIILINTIASELVSILRPLISKDANIFADSNSNALIITDVASNIYRIAGMLKRIDESPFETGMKIKVIPIRNADAKSIAQTLTEVFQIESEIGRGIKDVGHISTDELLKGYEEVRSRGATLETIKGRLQVIADENSNSLIVKTTEENMAIIEVLVQQLDDINFIQPSIKFFHLKYALAEDVAQELQDLIYGGATSGRMSRWQRRDSEMMLWKRRMEMKERGMKVEQTGIVGDVNIVSDERLNVIIVLTDPNNFPIIEKIVNELDHPETQEEFKIFFLKYANAEQVVATMQDVFEGESRGRLGFRNPENRLRRRIERLEWGGPGFGLVGEANLTYDERLNAVLVSTAAVNMPVVEELINRLDVTMPGQEWATKIYPLKYIDAEATAEIINSVYSGDREDRSFFLFRQRGNPAASSLAGNVTANPYPLLNALIISTSTAKNWELIEDFIKTLDVETPEEQREITKVVTLEYADAQQIQQLLSRIWWAPTMGIGVGIWVGNQFGSVPIFEAYGDIVSTDVNSLKGRVKVYADQRTNSLVITTHQRYWRDVENLIKELDVIRGQVWLDVQIFEVSLDETTKLGLEHATKENKTARFWKSPRPPLIKGEKSDGDLPAPRASRQAGKEDSLTASASSNLQLEQELTGFSYTLMTEEYKALLYTLMKENKLKTLSSVSLLTRDNKTVTLNRGKNIPYLKSAGTTSAASVGNWAGQPLYNYDFLKNVGVNVTVTPHITHPCPSKEGKTQENEEGKPTVGLDITQVKSSNFIEFTDFNAPITEDSTISVYVDVEDEQSVLIGGMIKSDKQNIERKIPIISDIPLVGRLFKKTETVEKSSEIIVIITPHIINVQGSASSFL
jgi:general secretion pathway protein D